MLIENVLLFISDYMSEEEKKIDEIEKKIDNIDKPKESFLTRIFRKIIKK